MNATFVCLYFRVLKWRLTYILSQAFFFGKIFYFNNSHFTTLQNDTINNQLQVCSVTNTLASAFEFSKCIKNFV